VTGTGGTFPSTAAAAAYVDGWDATQGTKADAAWTSGSGSVVAVLKAIDRDVLTPAVLSPTGNSTAGTNATTNVTCGSAVSSCVLKASPGNLYGVYANCTAACWIMVFNSTAAVAAGATTAGNASGNLVECIPVAAGLAASLSYPTFPRNLTIGITVMISSTACATLTLSTVGFVSGQVF
jgi:hypothetical protein